MPPGRCRVFRKTCRRYDEPGHAHALTFSCFRRQSFLSRDRARRWFIDTLAAARDAHSFSVWAYVVMPDHVHLVIWPQHSGYSISAILADLKQPVTRAALKFVRAHALPFLVRMRDTQPNGQTAHRFWQRGGGYDRNLIQVDEVCEKVNYIHDNPVRSGLVQRPEDWLWSSARYYADRNDGVLRPDLETLPAVRLAGGRIYPC